MADFEQACPPRLPYGSIGTRQTCGQAYTGHCTVVLGPIKCTNVCAQAAVLALGHSTVMNKCIQVDNWY